MPDALPIPTPRRPGLWIDIGANVGKTVVPPVQSGLVPAALAAEPDPENFAQLQRAIAGLPIQADQLALADVDGSAPFYLANKGTAHHLLPTGHDVKPRRVRDVPVRRLDTWLTDRRVAPSEVAIVKVDAQGWEPQILDGAPALLAERDIVWLIEISPLHLEKAGTTTANFLARLRARFATMLDLRRPSVQLSTVDLPALFEDIGPGQRRSYLDVAFY